jgi:methylenetetrahydrofolate reductase (NADPH)
MQGTAAMLDACQKAIDRGHRVVPRIAGRMIEDGRDRCRLVSRVQRMGVDDLFVIAGDTYRPVGGYADTLTFIKVIPGVRADRAVEGRDVDIRRIS